MRSNPAGAPRCASCLVAILKHDVDCGRVEAKRPRFGARGPGGDSALAARASAQGDAPLDHLGAGAGPDPQRGRAEIRRQPRCLGGSIGRAVVDLHGWLAPRAFAQGVNWKVVLRSSHLGRKSPKS